MSSKSLYLLCTSLQEQLLTKEWGMETKVSSLYIWLKGSAKLISLIENITPFFNNFLALSLKMFTTDVHMCFYFVAQIT